MLLGHRLAWLIRGKELLESYEQVVRWTRCSLPRLVAIHQKTLNDQAWPSNSKLNLLPQSSHWSSTQSRPSVDKTSGMVAFTWLASGRDYPVTAQLEAGFAALGRRRYPSTRDM